MWFEEKKFCKLDHRDARWSGFFVFVTPFHTYVLYVHTYPPELPAFVVFALGSQPSDWIARLWPFCCFVSESSVTSLKTWLPCLCPPDRTPPFSFSKRNFWNFVSMQIGHKQRANLLSTTPAEGKIIMAALQEHFQSRSLSFFTKCPYFTAGLCTPKTDIRRLFKCAQNIKLCTLSG